MLIQMISNNNKYGSSLTDKSTLELWKCLEKCGLWVWLDDRWEKLIKTKFENLFTQVCCLLFRLTDYTYTLHVHAGNIFTGLMSAQHPKLQNLTLQQHHWIYTNLTLTLLHYHIITTQKVKTIYALWVVWSFHYVSLPHSLIRVHTVVTASSRR